jgi:glutamine cyclotransferase
MDSILKDISHLFLPRKRASNVRRDIAARCLLPAILILLAAAQWLDISAGVEGAGSINTSAIPVYGYRIIHSYPHDSAAFTQGLVYYEGGLYEGTGGYGHSSLRRVDLVTGRVQKESRLPDALFGEGVAIWKDLLIQLTWRSGIGLVYGKENLTCIGDFSYPTEGWGITTDGQRLIMGDGTGTLRFLDPRTFAEQERIVARINGEPLDGLNELEYVRGDFYANLWPTDLIAIISPDTGNVKGLVDMRGLLQENGGLKNGQQADVLNGIAYDPDGDRLFVTGKLWPRLFEIEIAAKDSQE